jgi:hypothetical protein
MQGTELAKSEAPQFGVGESMWRLTKRSRHHLTGRGFHKLIRDALKRSREWP